MEQIQIFSRLFTQRNQNCFGICLLGRFWSVAGGTELFSSFSLLSDFDRLHRQFRITLQITQQSCQKNLLQSSVNWTYVINIASTDIPLRNNRELVESVEALDGANDVELLREPALYRYW